VFVLPVNSSATENYPEAATILRSAGFGVRLVRSRETNLTASRGRHRSRAGHWPVFGGSSVGICRGAPQRARNAHSLCGHRWCRVPGDRRRWVGDLAGAAELPLPADERPRIARRCEELRPLAAERQDLSQTSRMSQSAENRVGHLIADLDRSDEEVVLCALRAIGLEAVQPLAAAYQRKPKAQHRTFLIHALWDLRDPRAIPTLTAALRDENASVWKEALDGLVTLGGVAAISALEESRLAIERLPDAAVRRKWIDEALEQVRKGHAG
jgi:hypothetical protein